MTQKSDEIYAYISEHLNEFGYPPTVREICAELGIRSTSTVHRYLRELQSEGRITMGENQNRAITLNEAAPAGTIPVLGRGGQHRLSTIPGVVPSLLRLPDGCLFSDRCPDVFDDCRAVAPDMVRVAEGHWARCLKYA